jgi:hypothetical protein
MAHAAATVIGLLFLVSFPAWPASSFQGAPAYQEASQLGSIAGWLRRDGREGWLGADVADAVGIPRLATEDLLEARQRGFRDDEALRVAQVSADERRDFLLFMVQRVDGQVFFFLASVRDGLKSAFVSTPSSGLVAPLGRAEAQAAFQRELRFWGGRVAVR